MATNLDVVSRLKAGNQHYMENQIHHFDYGQEDRDLMAKAQKPFVAVVACSDSRVAPEILFDCDLGDLFVIRNAGNLLSDSTAASLEYAINQLDIEDVVVLGHSNCGAVTAAQGSAVFSKYLDQSIHTIQQHIEKGADLKTAAISHAEKTAEEIKALNIFSHPIKAHAAYFDIGSGKVSFQQSY